MFSFFSKMRLGGSSTPNTGNRDNIQPDEDQHNTLPWPVTESTSSRRSGSAAASAAVGGGPSMISLGRSGSGGPHNNLGGGGSSQHIHPITISNPILRATPTSLTGYDAYERDSSSSIRSGSASGRRGGPSSASDARLGGGHLQDPAQWYEHEIQKPKGRRLYPPASPQSQSVPHASGHQVRHGYGVGSEEEHDTRNEAERTYAPPAVIRLDSGAFAPVIEDDEDEEFDDDDRDEDRRYQYTSNPRASGYAVPYPYGSLDPGYTPHAQAHEHSSSSLASSLRDRDSRISTVPYLSSQFPQPPATHHTNTQRQSSYENEADLYLAQFYEDENEARRQSHVRDADIDVHGQQVAAASISTPVPNRSSASSGSSYSMLSGGASGAGSTPSPSFGGNGNGNGNGNGDNGHGHTTMSKAKWGLKLQMQQIQRQQLQPQSQLPASRSTTSLPLPLPLPLGQSTSASTSTSAPLQHEPSTSPHRSPSPSQQRPHSPLFSPPTPEFLREDRDVDTDVYAHAYAYPLAKQLSPIAEQDYISPSPQSSVGTGRARERNDSMSLRFGFGGGGSKKASPAVESMLRLKPSVSLGSAMGEAGVLVEDKASVKTRTSTPSRTASIKSSSGSLRTPPAMSRAPSGGAEGHLSGVGKSSRGSGGEMPTSSPKPSPFITRPLNRTLSQTSSKGESIFQGTPTPTHTHPGSGSQPNTPRMEGYIPGHARTMDSRNIAQLSTTSLSLSPRNTLAGTNTSPNTSANLSGSGSGSGSATIRGSTHTDRDRDALMTPNSAGPLTTPLTATSASMYTPTTASGAYQTPIASTPRSPDSLGTTMSSSTSTPTISIQPPPGAVLATTAPVQTVHGTGAGARGSRASVSTRRVDRLPVIEASVEGYYDDDEVDVDDDSEEMDYGEEIEYAYDEDDDEDGYDRESLHADSFVTATAGGGTSHYGGQQSTLELGAMPSREGVRSLRVAASAASMPRSTITGGGGSVRTVPRTIIGSRSRLSAHAISVGESFIDRRWKKDEGYGVGGPFSPNDAAVIRAKPTNPKWAVKMRSYTPAFWTFWLGFVFPVLWLVGGWHFTNAGEMPPKYTIWEWYFWKRRWRARSWMRAHARSLLECLKGRSIGADVQSSGEGGQRRKARRRTFSITKVRGGKVYPALPRWIAEKQSTDDGRMRLNDPKRSLRGIQFGYPFISRPPTSRASSGSGHTTQPFWTAPNRLLDQLYGVKLKEIRGRPESGRRMFDPWVQRCRYAFCDGLLLIAAGLCTASVYLIIVNTKNLHK